MQREPTSRRPNLKIQDPVNEAVVTMMQEAENPVVNLVFQDKDTGEKKKGEIVIIYNRMCE